MVKKGVTKVMSLLLATVVAFVPLPAHAEELDVAGKREETETCTLTLKHYKESLVETDRYVGEIYYDKISEDDIEVESGFVFDSDLDLYEGYTYCFTPGLK